MQILKTLPYEFSVCQLDSTTSVNFGSEYCFFARTAEGNFFGLPYAPGASAHATPRGWLAGAVYRRYLRFFPDRYLIQTQCGIGASQVGIFAVSTYNTDYIFVKKDQYSQAVQALRQAGYAVE